jgi:hypothetical protein
MADVAMKLKRLSEEAKKSEPSQAKPGRPADCCAQVKDQASKFGLRHAAGERCQIGATPKLRFRKPES